MNFSVGMIARYSFFTGYLYVNADSVANSGRSSVIDDHLGFLVGQNRCRFLEMTKHN